MSNNPEECGDAATRFRETFRWRKDPEDVRDLERLTAWAEGLCRSGVVKLQFAEGAKQEGPNLRLIPTGHDSSLFQIYNYHRQGGATPGAGVYLYSQSHVGPGRGGFRRRWWNEPYPDNAIQRLERAQAGPSGLKLDRASESVLVDVEELLQLASVMAESSTALTRPYRPRNERSRTQPSGIWHRDPDKIDRGTSAHRRLENEIALLAQAHGRKPQDHTRGEWDLAWIEGHTLTIVEVKSTTSENETTQLRLGLGQLLDYQAAAYADFPAVSAVLAVERPPADERWLRLCREHGVRLVWPVTFETLFD